MERIHAQGFAVEICDGREKDLPALAATRARFTSMTGYVESDLVDPDGADSLLRTAELSIGASRVLGTPPEPARDRPRRPRGAFTVAAR